MAALKRTGTTSPFFIPREDSKGAITPGECYLYVKVASAQAEYSGKFWQGDADVAITSQVTIDHPEYNPSPIFNIQNIRKVKKNTVDLCGLSSNLIGIVPATMERFGISVSFVLDKENKLSVVKPLIEDGVFQKAASFLPGISEVSGTVSELSKKIFHIFISDTEKETVLQLDADFNIAGGEVKDGYYVVLSSTNIDNPLPAQVSELSLKDGQLLLQGEPVHAWNYFVFEVRSIQTKSRALNNHAPWEDKLRAAESTAHSIHLDPDAGHTDRTDAWKKCVDVLKEAQTLLAYDRSYLSSEADNIIKTAYQKCRSQIFSEDGYQTIRFRGASPDSQFMNYGKELLNIPPTDDLEAISTHYLEACEQDMKTLKNAGLL